MILAPCNLTRIGAGILATEVEVLAHLSAAQAREKRLGLIGASFAVAEALGMVDALRQEACVQAIPARHLIR